MSLLSKLRGTIETIFSIGAGGPQLKNNTVATVVGIEARKSDDSGFVVMRAADPATAGGTVDADNDVVTKHHSDRRFSRSFMLMGA